MIYNICEEEEEEEEKWMTCCRRYPQLADRSEMGIGYCEKSILLYNVCIFLRETDKFHKLICIGITRQAVFWFSKTTKENYKL